ncbi:type II secretion system protein [Pelomonas sp. Root1217]|uniref:type II secretion system protein n=1 Tax=Pelomonas sp. Root1217 TaxID=1736430 RepID=UPI00138F19ED|nr:type II secretion system protein [Pelomonas sp. Root1217]
MRTERTRSRQRGFTLIEAVMTIVLTGIVITIVSVFIVPATDAYFASNDRAQLGEQADTALRRISRDLSGALPNSVRVKGNSLELIPVSGAARYATAGAAALQFGVAPISNFSIVGPPLAISHASQKLAWYNLGADTPDADAYAGDNVRVSGNAAGNAVNIGVAGAALSNALQSPPYRVYAIEPPVSYTCNIAAGTLTRYSGYAATASQADPPAGTAAVLARNVTACSFSYSTGAATARYALASLQISLTRYGETVSLYHTVHVDNLP